VLVNNVKFWGVVADRRHLVLWWQMLQFQPCDHFKVSSCVLMVEIQFFIVSKSLVVLRLALARCLVRLRVLVLLFLLPPLEDVGKVLFNFFNRLQSKIKLRLSFGCVSALSAKLARGASGSS
jgi:hypothetical protein